MKTTRFILKTLVFSAICIGFTGTGFAAGTRYSGINSIGFHNGCTVSHSLTKPVVITGVSLSFGNYGRGVSFSIEKPAQFHHWHSARFVKISGNRYWQSRTFSTGNHRSNFKHDNRCDSHSRKNRSHRQDGQSRWNRNRSR